MSLLVSRDKAPEQEMYAFFAANPIAFFKRELKMSRDLSRDYECQTTKKYVP